jgi:hypothetical protein
MASQSPIAPGAPDAAARLAHEHDVSTLAAALVARLLADGRADVAAAVVTALAAGDDGIIIAGPPNPHRPAT